jgi:branched-chain amino acid transport system ATP-binding protein
VLLGANGAGKSTRSSIAGVGRCAAIFSAMGCIYGAVARRGAASWRRPGAEGHPVLTGSVRDNLAAAALMHTRSEAEREIDAALKSSGTAHRLPDGGAIVRGQKQMVVIAQGMISRPRYLLIDELSFGLAPSIVGRLAETIQIIARRGVGILLIEQFTTLALTLAKSALVLERGELAFSGAAEELRRRPEILHDAYLATGKVRPS